MKNFLCLIFLILSFSSKSQHKLNNEEIDLNKLLKDILYSNSDNNTTIFLWMPDKYWDVIAARDQKSFPEEAASQVKQLIDNKTILLAISGKANTSTAQFVSKEESYVRSNLSIQFNGKTYKPLSESKLSAELNMLNERMRPLFSKMFGDLGLGMTMFFFDITDKDGTNLIDPYSNSDFTVSLDNVKHTFHLPLPSLYTDAKCPNDNELFPANYEYCPYHGSKLIAQ